MIIRFQPPNRPNLRALFSSQRFTVSARGRLSFGSLQFGWALRRAPNKQRGARFGGIRTLEPLQRLRDRQLFLTFATFLPLSLIWENQFKFKSEVKFGIPECDWEKICSGRVWGPANMGQVKFGLTLIRPDPIRLLGLVSVARETSCTCRARAGHALPFVNNLALYLYSVSTLMSASQLKGKLKGRSVNAWTKITWYSWNGSSLG